MGTKVKLVIIAAAFIMTSSAYAAEEPHPMTQSYSQKELLKNWALCGCLATIAKDKRDGEDAEITASAYMEFGHQGIEAYEQLRVLVKKYTDRHYGGSIPGDFNTMKCIDLFHSKELDRLTTKLVKEMSYK